MSCLLHLCFPALDPERTQRNVGHRQLVIHKHIAEYRDQGETRMKGGEGHSVTWANKSNHCEKTEGRQFYVRRIFRVKKFN